MKHVHTRRRQLLHLAPYNLPVTPTVSRRAEMLAGRVVFGGDETATCYSLDLLWQRVRTVLTALRAHSMQTLASLPELGSRNSLFQVGNWDYWLR